VFRAYLGCSIAVQSPMLKKIDLLRPRMTSGVWIAYLENISICWTNLHYRVLILLRNNRRLFGRVKAFDRHCNLVMEDVKEFWTEIPKGKGATPVNRDRNIGKLFVRGDSVVIVVKNPGDLKDE